MIEHERCPTEKISQQQNQSLNKQVQNVSTSHAVEACRQCAGRRTSLRVEKRAGCASGDAPFCAPGDALFCAPGDALVCAPGNAPVARRKTRRMRAGRRPGCAPCARVGDAPCARTGDAPDARRVRARARPFFLHGSGRRLEVVVLRGQRVANGAASRGRLRRERRSQHSSIVTLIFN